MNLDMPPSRFVLLWCVTSNTRFVFLRAKGVCDEGERDEREDWHLLDNTLFVLEYKNLRPDVTQPNTMNMSYLMHVPCLDSY